MQTVYGKLNYIIKDQHEEIEELERQIAELNRQIAQLNLQIESLQGDITLLTQQKEALEAQVAVLETQLQDTTQYYLPYIQGTATEFVSDSITSLRPYTFYYDTNITKVYLPNIETLPDYFFYHASNLEVVDFPFSSITIPIGCFNYCIKLNPCKTYSGELIERILPLTVEQSAFAGVGQSLNNEEMKFKSIENQEYIGNYAFQSSNITSISGPFYYIGNYAFASCSKLSIINIKVNDVINNSAFEECRNVSSFYIDPQSTIRVLSNDAFKYFGYNRTNPQNNIFEFDFQNSNFTRLNNGAFRYNSYFNIYLPDTVTNIGSYNFWNSSYIHLKLNATTPTVLESTFSATNSKIFVPINSLDAYKAATNWSAQAANIYPWKHYTAGDTLDTNYTWYSDIRLTNQVTGTAPNC